MTQDIPTTAFDFHLPNDRIAQNPSRPRDSARLLIVPPSGKYIDGFIPDILDLLRPEDIIVTNNTKVIPSVLKGKKGNAIIGITLDQQQEEGIWRVLIRNARRVCTGDKIDFPPTNISAKIINKDKVGGATLMFSAIGVEFDQLLTQHAQLAIPPYISRPNGPTEADLKDYNTIFSQIPGAIAAPTAGLHFTDSLLSTMKKRGIRHVNLTLHVGPGTFLPIRSDSIDKHIMHAEKGYISPSVATTINQTRHHGGKVIAIGTTTLRLLESATDKSSILHPFDGQTRIFIRPGYQFRCVDRLITNFHLPRSTLFMLVCAFSGEQQMKQAYQHAIDTHYRFYSYGDACFLYHKK